MPILGWICRTCEHQVLLKPPNWLDTVCHWPFLVGKILGQGDQIPCQFDMLYVWFWSQTHLAASCHWYNVSQSGFPLSLAENVIKIVTVADLAVTYDFDGYNDTD